MGSEEGVGGRGIDEVGVGAVGLGRPADDGERGAFGWGGDDGSGSLAPEIPWLRPGVSGAAGAAGLGNGGVGNGVAGLIAAEGVVAGELAGGLGRPTGLGATGATGAARAGALAAAGGGIGVDGVGTAGRAPAGDCARTLASPFGPNKSPRSAGAFNRFTAVRRLNAPGPMSERIVCSGNST